MSTSCNNHTGKPLKSKGTNIENIFGIPFLKLASEMVYETHMKVSVITRF